MTFVDLPLQFPVGHVAGSGVCTHGTFATGVLGGQLCSSARAHDEGGWRWGGGEGAGAPGCTTSNVRHVRMLCQCWMLF